MLYSTTFISLIQSFRNSRRVFCKFLKELSISELVPLTWWKVIKGRSNSPSTSLEVSLIGKKLLIPRWNLSCTNTCLPHLFFQPAMLWRTRLHLLHGFHLDTEQQVLGSPLATSSLLEQAHFPQHLFIWQVLQPWQLGGPLINALQFINIFLVFGVPSPGCTGLHLNSAS